MNLNFRNKAVSGIIFLTVVLLPINNMSAQNINFNYATSGLSTTDCNVFDPSVIVQSYTHTSFAGAPTFNGTSIYVPATFNANLNILAGTGYAISYPFTAAHGYAIGVNVTASSTNPNTPLPNLKLGLSSSIPSKNITCSSGWQENYSNTLSLSFPSIYNNILSASNQNIHVPAFIGSGQPYLLIGTYPAQTTSTYISSVYIGSISISDVPPITPSTASLQCSGSTQVLSVNTPYPVSWTSSSANVSVAGSGLNSRNGTVTAGNIRSSNNNSYCYYS